MPRKKITSHPADQSPNQQEIQQLVALSNSGNLAEAEQLARALTRRYPHHGFGWQALGTLLIQQGQMDAALPVLQQAAHLLPNEPRVLCNLGLAMMKAGSLGEAEKHYRQSMLLDPALAETHNNLGNALREMGRLDDAEACFRQAIALKPDYARALANLGHVLGERGKLTEAEASYRKALGIDPALAEALNSLAILLCIKDEFGAALDLIVRSLQLAETPVTKGHFVTVVGRIRFSSLTSPYLRNTLARALAEPWGLPTDISPTAAHLMTLTPGIGPAVARAVRAWPQRLSGQDLFGADGFAAVAGDPLMNALLISAPIYDVALERFLTMARAALLDAAVHSDQLAPAAAGLVLSFTSALAQQCFINEYVYAFSAEEAARAAALRDNLVAALERGKEVPVLWLVAVAAYFPLISLPGAERLLGCAGPAAVVAVLNQQIREPLAERQLGIAMPCLTALSEGVSRAVRSMYEENPYPRWVKLALPERTCLSIDQFIINTLGKNHRL